MFCPSTEISPSVASSSPAITESNVVFPHPLGPTNSVISPKRTSKSTPRSTSARLSPCQNSFFPCRQAPALPGISEIACVMSISLLLATEHDRRFEHQHPPNAHQARDDDDEEHSGPAARSDLPKQTESPQIQIVLRNLEESRGHANSNRVPDYSNHQRLQQNHSRDAPVRDADGF